MFQASKREEQEEEIKGLMKAREVTSDVFASNHGFTFRYTVLHF